MTLKNSFDFGSKAKSSEIGKKITDEGIRHVPDLYNYGTALFKKHIKNFSTGKVSKGLTNCQIETALKISIIQI